MKKAIFSFAVVFLTISLFAFIKPAAKHKTNFAKKTQTTYVYTGDNSLAQQRNSAYYVKDNNANPCSGAEEKICLIITEDDEGDHPDFSAGNPVDNPTMFVDVDKRPLD